MGLIIPLNCTHSEGITQQKQNNVQTPNSPDYESLLTSYTDGDRGSSVMPVTISKLLWQDHSPSAALGWLPTGNHQGVWHMLAYETTRNVFMYTHYTYVLR